MGTYKVQNNGKAQSGLSIGDKVVTGGGTYEITGVKADGSYESKLADKNTTTKNYTGSYSSGSSSKGSSSGSSSGSSGTSQRDRNNQTISQPGGKLYYDDGRSAVTNTGKAWKDGVDYAAEAAKYAAAGDWGGVNDILMRREAKMNALGITGVQSNLEVWKELNDKYNGPSAGKSLSDMQAGSDKAYGVGGSPWNPTNTDIKTTVKAPVVSGIGSTSGGLKGNNAEQYIKDIYEQMNEARLAALKSAYDQNVLDYKANAGIISEQAQQQRNQAASQNDLQRMYMNELGIMQGLNTGTTGQMALAQSAALQGNLASIGTQEQKAIADNSLALSKLKAQYASAVDQATAEGKYQLAQALYEEWVRQDTLARQQQATEQEQENREYTFDYKKQQDALADAEAKAKLLAGFGDFSGYKALGYSDAEIAMMQNAWNAQYGTPAVGTTGTTSTNPGYNNGGLTPDKVKALQNYYGVTADGAWGKNSTSAAGGMTAAQAWEQFTAPVTDVSQLSANGIAVANSLARGYTTGTQQRDAIISAYQNGRITQGEAAFLARAVGVSL